MPDGSLYSRVNKFAFPPHFAGILLSLLAAASFVLCHAVISIIDDSRTTVTSRLTFTSNAFDDVLPSVFEWKSSGLDGDRKHESFPCPSINCSFFLSGIAKVELLEHGNPRTARRYEIDPH